LARIDPLHLTAVEAIERIAIEQQPIDGVGQVQRSLAALVTAAAPGAPLVGAWLALTTAAGDDFVARQRQRICGAVNPRCRHGRQLDARGRYADFDLTRRLDDRDRRAAAERAREQPGP
jgi:hypothetical protein